MATISGSLAATGSVTLVKNPSDTLAQVQISGTYGSVSFVIEGTIDGTNWKGLGAIQNDTRTLVTGTISPADNSTLIYDVRAAGYSGVRARVTGIGTGTAAFQVQSGSYVGLPDAAPPGNVGVTSIGVTGALTTTAGTIASTEQTQMGSAAVNSTLGAFREEGNLAVGAGNPIGGNGADTTDDVLWGVQLPANVFDAAYRQILVQFQGQTGATTNNKRFKVFVNPTLAGTTLTNGIYSNAGTASGGTVILDSGAWVNVTTPNSNVPFAGSVAITKYGAANSNTQISGMAQFILGGTHGGAYAGQALTLTENAVINIVITGSSYTTGAANDVKLQTAIVTGSN